MEFYVLELAKREPQKSLFKGKMLQKFSILGYLVIKFQVIQMAISSETMLFIKNRSSFYVTEL